jgi:peptidoglycan/xylan/chitin deacetylase (PgdA/CDA1 family)
MNSAFARRVRGAISRLPQGFVRPFGRPVVLFFHGVEERVQDVHAQTNHHSVRAFVAIAKLLRDNFDVLPLTQIGQVIRTPANHRRTVFLASDDGYANTLSVAAGILESFALPWSCFISTRHIDTGARNPAFLARLFLLFAADGRYLLPHLDEPVMLGRARDPDPWIGRLKALPAEKANETVAAMEAALGQTKRDELLAHFSSDAFLDWDGVRALHRRGVEIGAHADTHWAMHAGQSPDYLREQAARPRARIEAEVGPCRYFAFPYGNIPDVSAGAWRAVRDAGYEYAFTTLSGSLDASTNPFLMPRYGLQAEEPRLPALVPTLRLGNRRLKNWQRLVAG